MNDRRTWFARTPFMPDPEDREPAPDHLWTCPGCGGTVNTLTDDYIVTPGLEMVCRPCGKKLDEAEPRVES